MLDLASIRIECISRAVDRGSQLLDTAHPGWYTDVSLQTLEMLHQSHCILGQLYGSFDLGLSKLGLNKNEAQRYGFALDTEWTSVAWKWNSLWRIEVRSREEFAAQRCA